MNKTDRTQNVCDEFLRYGAVDNLLLLDALEAIASANEAEVNLMHPNIQRAEGLKAVQALVKWLEG